MSIARIILWLTVFSVAMGYLESAVVVYLRDIYYPEGFSFPIKVFSEEIFITELLRETSTLAMLFSVAYIGGKNFYQRLANFIFCFAVWDIFYYAGLKLLLGWPESFLTWDILFLIPVIWAAPVFAPLICALTMILLAVCIWYFEEKGREIKINFTEWSLLIAGSCLMIVTFLWDYTALIVNDGFLFELKNLRSNKIFTEILTNHVPVDFHWGIFMAGELLLLSAIIFFCKRNFPGTK